MILSGDTLSNLGNELVLTVDNILYLDTAGTTTLIWGLPKGDPLGGKIAVSDKFVYDPSRYYGRLLVSEWTVQVAPETNSWTNICWSPELGIFVATALSGTNRIAVSNNGITWTVHPTPEANSWRAVAWGPGVGPGVGRFVAVAASGTNRIITSENGTTWSNVVGAPVGFFTNLNYLNGNYIILLGGSVYTSPDGLTWSLSTNIAAGDWRNSTYSPSLDLYIGVGIVSNAVTKSTNGVDWSVVTVAPEISGSSWWDICWSPELGLFCAVGTERAPTPFESNIITSPDGDNWTYYAVSLPSGLTGVSWSPLLGLFVAVGTDFVVSSPDGINWTVRSVPAGGWNSIAWSEELAMFCSVAESTANFLITPP